MTAVAVLAAAPTFAGAPQSVVLDVKNMICALCPITVKKFLEKVSGVATAKVDLDKNTATVTFDPERTTPAALTTATTNAGYPPMIHK